MAWTSTELLASVKRRAGMPVAQGLFTTAELLAIVNEQLLEYMVPLVLGVREDYWTRNHDVALADGTLSYRLPYRAIMGKLREVSVLDLNGNVLNLPRISLNDLAGSARGFWLEGDAVYLATTLGSGLVTDYGTTLRLVFHLRPNQIVETTAAGVVQSFDASARTITLASVPSAFATGSFDLIRARSPFDVLAYDAAATLSGSTLTFSGSLPADLAAGDYVALTEQSPVPQLPVELHGLLAQKTAVKILEAKQFLDKLGAAREELSRLEADAKTVLSPRVDGESLRVFNRGSLYRNRW